VTGRVITRPAPARLSRSTDVRRVLQDGKRRSGQRLALHGLIRSSEAPSDTVRLTVVASRRVGNAVQRNRAKRLLREAARTQVWREGLDVVLVARAACVTSGLDEVTEELRSLGTRLDVFEPDA
jgi:ribonuclease P protein component